jgi:hypothetical protein
MQTVALPAIQAIEPEAVLVADTVGAAFSLRAYVRGFPKTGAMQLRLMASSEKTVLEHTHLSMRRRWLPEHHCHADDHT